MNKSFLKFLTDFGPLVIFFYYYYDSGKDLKIAIEEAKKNGSPVPITEIIDGYYAEVQEMGGNRWDSSGLIARLKKKK